MPFVLREHIEYLRQELGGRDDVGGFAVAEDVPELVVIALNSEEAVLVAEDHDRSVRGGINPPVLR